MLLKLLLFATIFLNACAQEETKAIEPAPQQASSSDTSEPSPEVFTGVTCKEQEIPSWERNMKSLALRKCADCHNAKFAWNGIQLHTYELFKENAEISRERLQEDDLTIDIFLYEVDLFMTWFDAGMPKTEEDCSSE